MFIGSSYLSLDAKGRIAIPTKYRDDIRSNHEGEMILTADHGGACLALYPFDKWMVTQKNIREIPNLDDGIKDLMRTVFGYATEVKMDGQGRIMVSEPLRDYGGFDKKVVLVGQIDKFELWDEDRWHKGNAARIKNSAKSIKKNKKLKDFSI